MYIYKYYESTNFNAGKGILAGFVEFYPVNMLK